MRYIDKLLLTLAIQEAYNGVTKVLYFFLQKKIIFYYISKNSKIVRVAQKTARKIKACLILKDSKFGCTKKQWASERRSKRVSSSLIQVFLFFFKNLLEIIFNVLSFEMLQFVIRLVVKCCEHNLLKESCKIYSSLSRTYVRNIMYNLRRAGGNKI